jgi:hypothetical protein
MSDTPLCTSLLSPALSDFEMGFLLGIKAYDGYLETKEWLEKDGELGLCDPRHQFIAYFGSVQQLQANLQQWTQKRAELELAVIQERDVWAKPENPAPENPAPEPEHPEAAKETKRRRVEADTQLPIDGAFDAEEEQQQ